MPVILCHNTQRCCPPDWWNSGPLISFSQPPSACYGEEYSFAFEATGAGPFTWSSDDLPPELMLDPDTGVLSGIPFELGTFEFTVTVEDVFGRSAGRDYSFVVEDCTAVTSYILAEDGAALMTEDDDHLIIE